MEYNIYLSHNFSIKKSFKHEHSFIKAAYWCETVSAYITSLSRNQSSWFKHEHSYIKLHTGLDDLWTRLYSSRFFLPHYIYLHKIFSRVGRFIFFSEFRYSSNFLDSPRIQKTIIILLHFKQKKHAKEAHCSLKKKKKNFIIEKFIRHVLHKTKSQIQHKCFRFFVL